MVSVRIRSTRQNFENFIEALYCLDWMVSGGVQPGELKKGLNDIEGDVAILKHLINGIKVENEQNKDKEQELEPKKMDNYIYSTFAAFQQNKTQITLDLYWLNHPAMNKTRDLLDLRDLIMNKMDFLKVILKKEQEMILQTCSNQNYCRYLKKRKQSLLSLLVVISLSMDCYH